MIIFVDRFKENKIKQREIKKKEKTVHFIRKKK